MPWNLEHIDILSAVADEQQVLLEGSKKQLAVWGVKDTPGKHWASYRKTKRQTNNQNDLRLMLEEFLSMPAGHAAIYDRPWRRCNNTDLCPYLRWRAEEVPESEWHMTQIGWTKNAGHRSLENKIERCNRDPTQMQSGSAVAGALLELAERPSISNARWDHACQDATWRSINALSLATPSLQELERRHGLG